jgi:hypothetical protein
MYMLHDMLLPPLLLVCLHDSAGRVCLQYNGPTNFVGHAVVQHVCSQVLHARAAGNHGTDMAQVVAQHSPAGVVTPSMATA